MEKDEAAPTLDHCFRSSDVFVIVILTQIFYSTAEITNPLLFLVARTE